MVLMTKCFKVSSVFSVVSMVSTVVQSISCFICVKVVAVNHENLEKKKLIKKKIFWCCFCTTLVV